jgi:hypothetical protein
VRVGRSLPPNPQWEGDGAKAERSVWRWAVEQLPDDVLVLPNVTATVERDGGAPEEVEVDLVLVDPERGVTLVEVKGGRVGYHGGQRRWTGVHRNPVKQVKRARSIMQRLVEHTEIDPETVAWRWAVATPDSRLDAPGEPVLLEAQLWDALAATGLVDRYHRVCGDLANGERPLGVDRAQFLARFLAGRTREGRLVLTTAVDDHEERVRLHSVSHASALRQIWRHPRVLVRGAAGTGKTVLALEAAVTFASQGHRVLFTCWNLVLASWLRERLREELAPSDIEVTDDVTGQVVVSHLVGLARQADGAPTAVADDAPREEIHDHYHEHLPQALDVGVSGGPFDVVVLDEAQDLSEWWVWALEDLVGRDGRWYAFTDGQQDLFAQKTELAEFIQHPFPLAENFRNSRQVAEFAGRFGEISTDCVTGDGPPVRFVACAADRVAARTHELAKRLVKDGFDPGDVAALCLFDNPHRGHTEDVVELDREGELVATNSASFKGMERPAVVLGLDLRPDKADRADEAGRAIYAAATRARSHLTVVGDPEVVRAYGFDDVADALEDAAEG